MIFQYLHTVDTDDGDFYFYTEYRDDDAFSISILKI